MKKLSVILATLLLCASVANSQELQIIPRAEYSSDPEAHLGNSSLTTLFDWGISDHLSFSVNAVWLNSDPSSLYKNTLHSDGNSWLNEAYLSYDTDWLNVTVGKQVLNCAFFENADYDFDVHIPGASSYWNNFLSYQWGATLGFNLGESNTINLQAVTSPFGERPFASGKYAFSAKHILETDFISTMVSGNAINVEDNEYQLFWSAGVRIHPGNFTFGLDYMSRVGDEDSLIAAGNTFIGYAEYDISDKWQIIGKYVFEKPQEDNIRHLPTLAVHFFPIAPLRIHVTGTYDTDWLNVTVGATYNLSFNFSK